MAQLNFKISSAFDGEGFRAATQALNDNRKEINAAKTGLGELTTALGKVSPEASTATSTIKTFTQAFATGGIVGGVIQLAIKGISEAISYFADKAAEAKEATKQYAQMLRDNLVGALTETNSKFNETKTKVNDVKTDLQETVKLLNGDINAQVKTEIHRLHIEKLQSITDDMDEAARKMLEEQYKGKEALVKANAEVEKAINASEAATTMVNKYLNLRQSAYDAEIEAENRFKEVQNNCNGYITARNRILDHLQILEDAYKNELISTNQIQKDRKTLNLQLKNLESEHKSEITALKNAEEELAAAHENVKNAESAYTASCKESQDALRDVNTAQLALKEAELEAAQGLKDLAQKAEDADFSNAIVQLFGDVDVDGTEDLSKIAENTESTKDTLKDQIKPKVDKIKDDQNKYGSKNAAMNVQIPDFTPGTLPTLQEIREQRQKIEAAPEQMAYEANAKYGYHLQLYLKKLADKNGKLTEEDIAPFQDVITGVKSLPIDVAAQTIQKAASRSFFSSDFRKFFSDIDNIKSWLTGDNSDNPGNPGNSGDPGNPGNPGNPGSPGDSPDDNAPDLSGIKEAIEKINTTLKEKLGLN